MAGHSKFYGVYSAESKRSTRVGVQEGVSLKADIPCTVHVMVESDHVRLSAEREHLLFVAGSVDLS